jgi:hypothetical protein
MNEMLEKILNEVQGLKKEMNLRFKEQDERIEARFKEQDDKIAAEFKSIYEKFDTQTKEIAQEIRTMADFIYERDKKLIKELEKKIDEEIKYNKIAHEAYDARFRKLEIEQVYFNNERKAS